MEVPLLNSEIVGDLANIAQLTGLDAVKIIALIIRAASSPQILKRRCRQFGRHVKDIGDLLEELNITEMMEYQETRNPLNRLEEALKKSYVLVEQCQNSCFLHLLLRGFSISHGLKQAQAEIDDCLKIIPLIVLKEVQRLREHYVNAREDEECKKKLAAQMAAIDIFRFKQLLDEASGDINDKTNYEYFAKKWGHDERFEALDRRQRESLLNERMLSLGKDLEQKRKTRHATSFKAINSSSERSMGNPSDVHLLVGELLDDGVLEEFIEDQGNPSDVHLLVGELLDDGVLEESIEDLIMSVGDSLPVEQLIEECEKRNRLRLLKRILERLVSEGSQDVHVHSALGKIIVDTNDNPEHFLTANPYYDSYVVGKYCEKRDPTLAVVAYKRAQYDDELIDVTNKNNLFKVQARYVVERADPQLWKKVLALENPLRSKLIDQVVSSALQESNNPDQISATVKAFSKVDRPHELIELLEKIVLQNSTISGDPNLQCLLIRTAIEADGSRLMDYINRLDNFDGPAIGEIAVAKKLYEEAFHIFKKFNLNVQAVNVLLNHIRSFESAVEFASRVKEDAVWSQVAKAQLREGLLSDAIESFIRADDATQFPDVIRLAEESSLYHELVKYLFMVKKKVKEPKFHTELNAKLATIFVKLRQFQKAVHAAQKVNSLKTWKEVCFACVDAEEFILAQRCGLNIFVQEDGLEEVSDYYRKRGRFYELISLMEESLGLECWPTSLTELRILYAQYCPDKLKEHIALF